MHRDKLAAVLNNAWSEKTSAAPEGWTLRNPAYGQCAVTALVVQDHLGAEILHCHATTPDGVTVSHYLNEIDGAPVDFTASQFPPGTKFSDPAPKLNGAATPRDYLLSNESTALRYRQLKARIHWLNQLPRFCIG